MSACLKHFGISKEPFGCASGGKGSLRELTADAAADATSCRGRERARGAGGGGEGGMKLPRLGPLG